MDRETMKKNLEMPHLQELKEEVDTTVSVSAAVTVEPATPKTNLKTNLEYEFEFDWEDKRGQHWTGTFCNKILTIGERQSMGILRARLGGGVAMDSLDPLTQELNLMVSHMTYSLKESPEWAKDLNKLTDISLVQAIYEEVIDHEATFLGYKKAAAESQG